MARTHARRIAPRSFARALGCALAAGLATVVWAAAGDYDTSFGSGGVSITSTTGIGQHAGHRIQSDGRIVMAGTDAAGGRWRVRRYLADGSLDTSFGSGGSAQSFTTSATTHAMVALALDGDEILGGGQATLPAQGNKTWTGPVVVRWTADGALDASFGSGGVVRLSSGTQVNALALQPDGKVLAAGYVAVKSGKTTQQGWFLARLNANGSLDGSFGSGGVRTHDPSPAADRFSNFGLAVLPDGKVVLGGTTGGSVNAVPLDWTLVRFTSAGAVDATYVRPSAAADGVDGLAVDASGRIVPPAGSSRSGARTSRPRSSSRATSPAPRASRWTGRSGAAARACSRVRATASWCRPQASPSTPPAACCSARRESRRRPRGRATPSLFA
jgi:uncharacterized delta-60 repeat protein